jgi:hypothetical protein
MGAYELDAISDTRPTASEWRARMSKNDLTKKVHNAIVGHDMDEIIDVLMCALGIAINANLENVGDRLDEIMDIHRYLLDKSMQQS